MFLSKDSEILCLQKSKDIACVQKKEFDREPLNIKRLSLNFTNKNL